MSGSLKIYLSEKIKICAKLELRFLYFSDGLYLFTIISSAIATALAALTSSDINNQIYAPFWTAVFAAVPGVMVSIDNKIKPRARSDWNAECKIGYASLLRRLLYEEAAEAAVSVETSNFEKVMEARYPVKSGRLRDQSDA